MNTRKYILRQTLMLGIGQLVCIGVMWGIFALMNHFDYTVVLGGIFGGILAVGNFFFMAIASEMAADSAIDQDVTKGKKLMKASYRFRLLIMGVLLVLLAKSGHCNLLALVCPLFFTFPVIMVIEFFRKAGDTKK